MSDTKSSGQFPRIILNGEDATTFLFQMKQMSDNVFAMSQQLAANNESLGQVHERMSRIEFNGHAAVNEDVAQLSERLSVLEKSRGVRRRWRMVGILAAALLSAATVEGFAWYRSRGGYEPWDSLQPSSQPLRR